MAEKEQSVKTREDAVAQKEQAVTAREQAVAAAEQQLANNKSAAEPSAPMVQTRPPTRPASTDPRFDTCTAAKAAGYGPYRAGVDHEYDWYQDRDSDGIVCE